jgi:hypothetical protein
VLPPSIAGEGNEVRVSCLLQPHKACRHGIRIRLVPRNSRVGKTPTLGHPPQTQNVRERPVCPQVFQRFSRERPVCPQVSQVFRKLYSTITLRCPISGLPLARCGSRQSRSEGNAKELSASQCAAYDGKPCQRA